MTATQMTKDRRRRRASRLIRLEQLYAQGLTSPTELAVAFGVSVPVIIRDIKCIERDVLRRSRRSKRKQRNRRIMQIESIMYEARNAFNRSRKEPQLVLVDCAACGGGQDEAVSIGAADGVCEVCNDTGKIVETVESLDLAGDSAFLRIALQAAKECGKLEGLYERKAGGSKSIAELALINNIHVNTPLEGDTTNPFHGIPAERLIEARAMLMAIRENMPDKPSTMVQTIDTTVTPTTETRDDDI